MPYLRYGLARERAAKDRLRAFSRHCGRLPPPCLARFTSRYHKMSYACQSGDMHTPFLTRSCGSHGRGPARCFQDVSAGGGKLGPPRGGARRDSCFFPTPHPPPPPRPGIPARPAPPGPRPEASPPRPRLARMSGHPPDASHPSQASPWPPASSHPPRTRRHAIRKAHGWAGSGPARRVPRARAHALGGGAPPIPS